MKVEFIAKKEFHAGHLCFQLPTDEALIMGLRGLWELSQKKYGGYIKCTFEPPYKKRTTGDKSQNHHLNGHILQICLSTGQDFDSVKDAVKMIAVEQLGYPYNTVGSRLVPKRERYCTTEECAKLIEASHYLAAELGIILKEE